MKIGWKTHSLSTFRSAFMLCLCLTPANVSHADLPAKVGNTVLPSLAPMLENVLPAVVNVSVTNISQQPVGLLQDPFLRQFFDLPGTNPVTEKNAGSGVILDATAGLIVTNHHVVEDAQSISVTLYNEQELQAEVIGTDDATDLALLRVQSRFLQSLPPGDSDALRIGDFVVAVGNPFGLGHSVTSGIVSALGRTGLGIEHYEDFIQTDASINPGNSGGALVNLRGELIGINTAILAPGGGNIGIGFAIPINRIQLLTAQLIQYGDIKRGILGVVSEDLPHEYTSSETATTRKGALITRVIPRSPAAKSNIEPGDIVVQIGEQAIDSASDLRNTLGLIRAGSKRRIRFWRGAQLKEIQVIIEDPELLVADSERIYRQLSGANFLDITISTRNGPRGAILIASVDAGTQAAKLGLKRDDIIIAVNQNRIESLDELRAEIEQASTPFSLNLERDGQVVILKIL
ncbi:MAG: Do family serine endopeptidase [Proteobacteria bacterium]|nr:Do family serine endopeptidase [Pseudomonadota bacterium]